MYYKKNYFLSAAVILAAVLLAAPMKAQVTIGELTRPNPDAVLDVRSKGKLGLLLPQVELVSRDLPDPLSKNVAGMIVYNTKTAGSGTNQVVPGFYYNDGNQWVQLSSGSGGNAYTGSTSIALNGTSFERAALTGDVTAAQNSNATVISDGAVTSAKILDGTITGADIAPKTINVSNINGSSTTGQVPVSDASGNVTWQTPSGGANYTAANGLTLSGTEFQLGGALSKNTTISAAGPDTLIVSAPLAITSGNPGDDKVLTSDANGNTSWLKLPEVIAKNFIISPIKTGDVQVTNEDLVLVEPDNTTHTLSLPTTATVGRVVYVVNIGNKAINLSPLPVNTSYQAIDAGVASMYVYAGNGNWYCLSGI